MHRSRTPARSSGDALIACALDEVVDHPGETELHPVFRVIEPGDPEALELGDLSFSDRAAAAAEHEDVTGATLTQHLHGVPEELGVAALV